VTRFDDTQLDDGGRRKPPSDRAAAAIHRKLANDAYDAAEKFRKLGLTTSEASAREAARAQDSIAELLEGRVLDVAASHDPSDCPGDERVLDFVAHYGAPGIGQAWHCRVCGREWAKLGGSFFDPATGVHELRPEDVR
jgi:hypothetical protein